MDASGRGPRTRPERRNYAETLWFVLVPVLGQLTLAALAALLAMWAFVKLAHEVNQGETRQFDVAILHFLRTHQDPSVHTLMEGISWLGGPHFQPWFLIACVLGLVIARRFWPDGLTLLIAGGGGAGVIYALKRLFHRPRPEAIFDTLGYSFPSGHSFFALVTYGLLAYWLSRDAPGRRRRWIWAIAVGATLLVGFGRVYLGEHFPSDVAAGFAVALPWLWGCLALPMAFHRHGRDISPEEKRAEFRTCIAALRHETRAKPHLRALAVGLADDTRVPRGRKVALRLLITYLALPFDPVPDFIPVLGAADDVILAVLVVRWVAKGLPGEVIRENWNGEGDLFDMVERVQGLLKRLWEGR